MKKSAIAVLLIAILLLSGCGSKSQVSQAEYDKIVAERDALLAEKENSSSAVDNHTENETADAAVASTAGNTVINNSEEIDLADLIEVKTFTYPHWEGMDLILVVSNGNNVPVRFEVNVTARDSSGSAIGSESETIRMIPKNSTIPAFVNFKGADENTTYDYTIKVKESDLDDATEFLSVEASTGDKEAIMILTNNSDRDMTYCSAHCLFYLNDELVYCNYEYVGDGLGDIGPGETYSRTVGSGRNDFDRFEWYVAAGYKK